MNAKYSLLEKIKDGSFALLTSDEISRKLRLGRREAFAVHDMLSSLVREGELLCDRRGRFGTAEQFGAEEGVFSGSGKGYGLFSSGETELFIPAKSANGAVHGDRVLAIPVKGGRSDDEGEVLAVLARGYEKLVGTFCAEGKAGYVVPDDKRFGFTVFVPRRDSAGARDGAKVVVKVSYPGEEPCGKVLEVLGQEGDLMAEELAVIRSHALREEFPEEVLAAADKVPQTLSERDLKGREDLREELIITIDGEDTRDIDDAVSVHEENGKFHLGVHIADVSHYVLPRSPLDREAFARGTSVYFPDRVLPMLPKALSNGICSLNEGEDRLTLSCFMTIDGKGKVLKKRIAPTVIRSRHRMTYTAVTAIAEGDRRACEEYPDLVGFVRTAVKLTKILRAARAAKGGVELEIGEAKILCEDGKIEIPENRRTVSHEMIERFMVLANESVAELMTEKGVPFVYRVHDRPAAEKAASFRAFLLGAGLTPRFEPDKVAPRDYRDLLASLGNSPLAPVVHRVMLRSMAKAVYSPENIGHFGLASECYCHFTSPIRRYPDLCVHRIIRAAASGKAEEYRAFVKEAAAQSSLSERNAAEAEREADALYIAFYMKDRIGEEYNAVVSGVTAFGLFAELDNTVEGFIPVETLPEDCYLFEEENFLLRGVHNSFRLGERVRVRVDGADIGARRVQFFLLNKENG